VSAATETTEATPLLDRPALPELPVDHLCDLRVDLEPAQTIPTPVGTEIVFIIKHGTVEGSEIKGEVLPGGGDWLLVGEDHIARVDVRATIRTNDDALIHYTARGTIQIPADGLERLAAGERLPFEETYARTTPSLETADERYSWLNRLVLVTHSQVSRDHIDHRIYRVL
jgi:Protein of unknown function (DUF3237)